MEYCPLTDKPCSSCDYPADSGSACDVDSSCLLPRLVDTSVSVYDLVHTECHTSGEPLCED